MIELTEGQSNCLNAMEDFMVSDENKFLIQGWAGTGKSYLITHFIKGLLENGQHRIAMTAPTNKAVSVLGGYIDDSRVKLSTIHSLMGLRAHIDRDGSMKFKQADKVKVAKYDVIVIDEASMINDDLLLGNKHIVGLFEIIADLTTKIIFVGDAAQIPPVGKDNSIPMSEKGREKYSIFTETLDEVVRQAGGNPIIKLATGVRNAIGRDILIPIRKSHILCGVGYKFMDYDNLNEYLRKYFTSPQFTDSLNFVKIIAWRNKTVDKYNVIVRSMIYDNPAKICIGERLIAKDIILSPDGSNVLLTINSEFVVGSFEIKKTTHDEAVLTYYAAKVYHYNMEGDKVVTDIRIIHEDSEEDYQLIKNYYLAEAKVAKKGSFESATYWKKYYNIGQVFASVKYSYAITAHSSQGSTYTNAFVLEDDMDANFTIVERNRIKYTAFTRPSKRLLIIK